MESIISIDKEINGKLLPNLYTISSLDFVKIVYAPGYQRWLIIDCVPIMCEYRTSEFEGLYIGVNMKKQQVIKGLELCKILKPRWIKNIDDYGIPHLHNGDEVKFDDLGRVCF